MESALDTAKLGAFVRDVRTQRRLSIRRLAEMAGISESTMHRIEHGPTASNVAVTKPTPARLASVFRALELDEGDVRPVLAGDDEYADQVVYWMSNTSERVSEYAAGRRLPHVEPRQPDLVLLHPDGTVAIVEVKTYGSSEPDQQRARVDELARFGRAAGYMVTIPAG